MNSIDQQNVAPQTSFDLSETISIWLREFEVSLSKCDSAAVAALFEEDGNWRDVLAFTWHLTPVVGAVAIAGTMVGRQQAVEARGFGISPDRTPPRLVTRLGRKCIEAIICFETKVGRGEGALRLTADANGD